MLVLVCMTYTYGYIQKFVCLLNLTVILLYDVCTSVSIQSATVVSIMTLKSCAKSKLDTQYALKCHLSLKTVI